MGKETFGFVKLGEFLNEFSNYGFLKNNFFITKLVIDSIPLCVLHQDEKYWHIKNFGQYKLHKIHLSCVSPLCRQDSDLGIPVNIFIMVTLFPIDRACSMEEHYSASQTILITYHPQNICSLNVIFYNLLLS